MQFKESLAIGRVCESKVACWLRFNRGWSVLPVYEIAEGQFKGPQFFTPEAEIVAPDMLAMKGATVRWIEAKQKSVFSWHRITGRWVTGIDLKLYDKYLQIALCSPFPVWLMFYHTLAVTSEGDGKCPTGLYGNDIVRLSETENHRHENWGRGGMVYWAKDSLIALATCEEVEEAYRKRAA